MNNNKLVISNKALAKGRVPLQLSQAQSPAVTPKANASL